MFLQNKGYLPEAIINFVILMGWHSDTTQEIFSLKELKETFKLEGINRSSDTKTITIINYCVSRAEPKVANTRLDWINFQHFKRLLNCPQDLTSFVESLSREVQKLYGYTIIIMIIIIIITIITRLADSDHRLQSNFLTEVVTMTQVIVSRCSHGNDNVNRLL